ncbi:MAG: sulfatase [Candidatus Nanohaloarchaea archaeon]
MQNVVLIVIDSLRKDSLGPYSQEVDFTDSLDRFADESVVYRNAIATSSWTLPVHASMFTGEYPWEHRATQRNLELDYEKKTLAEKLGEKGFRTGCFTENAWISEHAGMTVGFDVANDFGSGSRAIQKAVDRLASWVERNDNVVSRLMTRVGDYLWSNHVDHMAAEEVLDRGMEFVESSDERFFLFMNLMDVHEPLRPPGEYVEDHGAEKTGDEICQDPSRFYRGREVDFDEIRKHYDAAVDYVDDCVGKFLQELRSEGLMDETCVLIASDHGQLLGEHGHYGHQFSVADELVEVPLMLRAPTLQSGEVDETVSVREMHDMILEAAGGEKPSAEKGSALGLYDFPDMMSNRIPESRREELYRRQRFAVDGSSKIVETETESGKVERKWKGKEKEELKEKLEKIKETGSGEEIGEKEEEIKRQLEALGYG